MILKRLYAKGFMSFAEVCLEFEESGLIFVGGNVTGSSSASSNGAGKSALFEILCYSLYGRTIRNASAGEVVNRKEKDAAVVAIDFVDDDGGQCIVTRTKNAKGGGSLYFGRDDIDLSQGSVGETQDIIDHHLGMSWLVFSTAVIFGEKAQRFIEAKDDDKKKIFDEILLLGCYQEAQQVVKQDIKANGLQIVANEASIARTEEGIRVARESLETDIRARIKKLEEDKKQSVAHLKALCESVRADKETLELKAKEKEGLTKEHQQLQEQSRELYSAIKDVEVSKQKEVGEAEKVLYGLKIGLAGIAKIYDPLKLKRSAALSLKGGVSCPTCGQQVTDECKAKLIKGMDDEIAAHDIAISHAAGDIQAAEENIKRARAKFEQDTRALNQLLIEDNAEVNKVWTRIIVLDSEARRIDASLKATEREADSIASSFKREEETLKNQERASLARIKGYEESMGILAGEKKGLEEALAILRFWEVGFGNQGIKSFLLDEILPQLNSRANFYASTLLDEDIEIFFDTEKAIKSGEMRDKFSVMVKKGDKVVEYASFSSGEKRRIDVAILLSLQSLVLERSAGHINISVLDEVFDSLDRTGVERVATLLAEESKTKAIYVISHLSEFRDYFEKEIVVQKTGGYSTIEGAI